MADPAHNRLLSLAVRISAFSVAWSLVAASVAITAARVTHSPSLTGFGLASAIDAAASVILIRYFRARVQNPARADRMEKFALGSVGTVLIVAGAYVALRSISLLTEKSSPEASAVGVAISGASLAVLPVVATIKLRLAAKIPSAALRSDGVLTGGAAILAAAALVAVSLQGSKGLWWLDPAIALVIAGILVAEGTRTLRSETS